MQLITLLNMLGDHRVRLEHLKRLFQIFTQRINLRFNVIKIFDVQKVKIRVIITSDARYAVVTAQRITEGINCYPLLSLYHLV